MAYESHYKQTCDNCGHQIEGDVPETDDGWWELYRGWRTPGEPARSEEFDLCSDECAAAFDPREHRSYT